MKQTYKQNWHAYNAAQCSEKPMFIKLLSELCQYVEQPQYSFGRPSIPLSDMIFCSVMKVYSMRSLRRFLGDLKVAEKEGYIGKIPSFASIGHFLQREDMTEPLMQLIQKSSLPLRSVETDFAADSSGFTTCRYTRWFDFKYGREKDVRIWLKAHILTGVKTNIVASVRITEANRNDSPQFSPMVKEAHGNGFTLREVSGDKAYSSRENMNVVEEVGGTPFIAFRSNAGKHPWGSPMWKKMYHYFMYNQEEFMRHYHKRSNVESTFSMLKAKFGSSLKSKTKAAQINEVLLKILCHNLCVLIQEMHELNNNRGNDNYDG